MYTRNCSSSNTTNYLTISLLGTLTSTRVHIMPVKIVLKIFRARSRRVKFGPRGKRLIDWLLPIPDLAGISNTAQTVCDEGAGSFLEIFIYRLFQYPSSIAIRTISRISTPIAK